MDDSAGEVQAPLHAPAEPFDRLPGPVLKPGEFECLLNARAQGRIAQALRPTPILEVFPGREVVVKSDLLRHNAYGLARCRALPHHVMPHHAHAPGGGRKQARDAADGGGLPSAVWPQQAEHLAGARSEGHAIHRR